MWNSYLPEDVLVVVLIRLPAKSLGRCKSVSKAWNFLISSSEFIGFHLQCQSSIQKNSKRLLSTDVDEESEAGHETHLAEYSINEKEDWENLELGCEIQRIYNPYESHAPGMTSMLVGSCNGLLCQVLCHSHKVKKSSIYGEYELSLCNPLTKSTWVLPKSPLVLEDVPRRRRRRRIIAFYGFGFDDVHETYKVFIASGPPHDEYEYRPYKQPDAKYEFQVYSLRSNKWIIVRSDLDFHDYFFHCPRWNLDGVLINSALHWILRNPYGPLQNKKINYILAFDLRVDKHNILPLPDDAEECHALLLTVLNGCLLLSDGGIKGEPEATFDMWVMKDYGMKDSWTRIRIRSTPYDLCYITPVALLEEEDNHLHKRKLIYHDIRLLNGTILLDYDIESHQVGEFPTPSGTFGKAKHLQFVGSLVQPHPPSFPLGNKKSVYTRVKKTMAEFGPSPSPRKKLRSWPGRNLEVVDFVCKT